MATMPRLTLRHLLLPAALWALVAKSTPVDPRQPLITPAPELHPDALRRRDIVSDASSLLSDVTDDIGSVLSEIGSAVPSFVASGIPAWYTGLPDGPDAVESSLGIDDSQVAALPTEALNFDPYANYTDDGWQIRFRGFIYKQPNTTEEKLNDLANVFLVGTSIEDLNQTQQEQTRNVTAEIFIIQQGNVAVSPIHIEPSEGQGSSGEPGGGGAVTPSGGAQDITLPYNTTAEGDFDVFVPINSSGLAPGNQTNQVQRLNTFVTNTTLGNGTAYLVPNEGLTIISDIDDILRVTRIWQPEQGLIQNTFSNPFTPWQSMPEIYANWSSSVQGIHFHYLTTTPEQITRTYMQFIYSTYPGGSFDTRPLNFSDISATLSVRKYLLEKIIATFPNRKFVLVADTSNSDVMKDYPLMAKEHPDQIHCILLRNTSSTDPTDKFPYDSSGFQGIPQSKYMFFVNSEDLTNIDIATSCYNQSVPQNLTYGYQNLPGNEGDDVATNSSAVNATGASPPSAHAGSSHTLVVSGLILAFFLWQLL